MTPSMVAELSYTRLTPTSQWILDGRYSNPDVAYLATSNLLDKFSKKKPNPPGWSPPSNMLSTTKYRHILKATCHQTAAGLDDIISTMIQARTW